MSEHLAVNEDNLPLPEHWCVKYSKSDYEMMGGDMKEYVMFEGALMKLGLTEDQFHRILQRQVRTFIYTEPTINEFVFRLSANPLGFFNKHKTVSIQRVINHATRLLKEERYVETMNTMHGMMPIPKKRWMRKPKRSRI